MITASEPLEFIPRGRRAVEEHPGPLTVNRPSHATAEQLLLNRLENINISRDVDCNNKEFWEIREVVAAPCKSEQKESRPEHSEFMTDSQINSEDELYVKGHTAVWLKGVQRDDYVLPRTCFTCETHIKFAFFCSPYFYSSVVESDKRDKKPPPPTEAICLIDAKSLRVYCSSGDDYIANLEFPVSNVWRTNQCVLLEKEAATSQIDTQAIAMPRLFSLTHALDEMCPVLFRGSSGIVNYFVESDYRIIYSTEDNSIVLLYDNKIGRHFSAILRTASVEEITTVSGANDTAGSAFYQSLSSNVSWKNSIGGLRTNLSVHNKSTFAGGTPSPFSAKAHSTQHSISSHFGTSLNRSHAQSPLSRLQSSMGGHSMSVQNMRKIGLSQPSKPIVPQFCLEYVWAENITGKEFSEGASHGFMHTDFAGQVYLCYQLIRTCRLYMVRVQKTNDSKTIFGVVMTLPVKDATALKTMRMIAAISLCGTLTLYTGPMMVGKIHVGGILTGMASPSLTTSNLQLPRRSSLLPSALHTPDSKFEDELHSLSPVYPLQPSHSNRNSNCIGIRDAASNRLTLIYPGGKMFRVTLPFLSESPLVTRALMALRQILQKDMAIKFLIRWYGTRNAPGSDNISPSQEWNMFCNVLLEQMGRPVIPLEMTASAANVMSDEIIKRRRTESLKGTDEDWQFVLALTQKPLRKPKNEGNTLTNDVTKDLFPYIPIIFYTLHLLYEDLKLDSLMSDCLKCLAGFLYQIAMDLHLNSYCLHYFQDFPTLVQTSSCCPISEAESQKFFNQNYLLENVPCINKQVCHILEKTKINPYPVINVVNQMSRHLVQIMKLIATGCSGFDSSVNRIIIPGSRSDIDILDPVILDGKEPLNPKLLISAFLKMGITRNVIERLPTAFQFVISEMLEKCRQSPPVGFESSAYELLLRPELASHANFRSETKTDNLLLTCNTLQKEHSLTPSLYSEAVITTKVIQAAEDCGMENVDTQLLSLRFSEDMRIREVKRLLDSSTPVTIDVTQAPGVTDHDFLEEQEKQLFSLCTRTMALPMGRGMFTLRTCTPLSTESLPIPKLCLFGKEPTKGATIEMQQIEVPPHMSLWPVFHNGVAAGLRVSSDAKDIDSTWIVYNKPKGVSDVTTDHAGFLMALGLNGHLRSLSSMSIYDYLIKTDEITSVGLLLGIAAAYRGTSNMDMTKLFSVHIEALLPPTSVELDIAQNTQVAAIMGIGLLYQESAKRHIAEVLLQEIGRPPGPEMDNSVERESYALTAGLALGLVTLGQGETPTGLKDLKLPDTLHYYMVGGNKRPLLGSQKEKFKLPSFQVREGDAVNIDVTAPGATLALGLMFFKTGDLAVAHWMRPPDTSYLLEVIRPDLLLLRIIARGLILWDTIEPTQNWLSAQVPETFKFDFKKGPSHPDSNVDHEAVCQAYCNITAGSALCLGLRYAGTENQVAFETLKATLDAFISMNGQYIGEYAGKATVETSTVLTLLSMSLVFAGSGNLTIMRYIRMLRSRIGQSNSHVTYGSQMAIHMALGFLFLGAGRFTLSRSPQAIAALVCALFPKFPTHSNDNRYHLQAFRHLYVLAVEPRLFLPRDIDSGKLCLCNLSYVEVDSMEVKSLGRAPCMLPELDNVRKIIVDDPNYWKIVFEKGHNWEQLTHVLAKTGCIDIKQRAGCLSHLDDPDRLKGLFAQTLTTEQFSCWKLDAKALNVFLVDSTVKGFAKKFLSDCNERMSKSELQRIQSLTIQFYNCLKRDKMHALPIYMDLCSIISERDDFVPKMATWQFKIIQTFINGQRGSHLLSKEIFQSMHELLLTKLENWTPDVIGEIKQYLCAPTIAHLNQIPLDKLYKLVSIISFYDLPLNVFNCVNFLGKANYIQMLIENENIGLETKTLQFIYKILNTN